MSNIDSNEKVKESQENFQDEKTLNFIRKARLVHGDRYNYSKVQYIKAKSKIKIICYNHGEFLQTPDKHLSSKIGCRLCGIKASIKKSNTEEFIRKAKLIHGDFYDYSKVKYVKAIEKVIISCPLHGEFLQSPSDHLANRGCRKCTNERLSTRFSSNSYDFIRKAKIKHGEKYDYSFVNYINCKIKVEIICPTHGKFWQLPSNHLYGQGCYFCSNIKNKEHKTKTLETFIKEATLKHGDFYDYSLVDYKGSEIKVEIVCPIHGSFWQRTTNHLSGVGCPICGLSSKGEMKIRNYLQSKNIEFTEQKTFKGCKYKALLKFDFYIPSLNLCIEYDGEQHFKPFSFNKESEEIKIKNFENLQKRDNIKNNYCKENNINLLRIRYDEDVEEKLKGELNDRI